MTLNFEEKKVLYGPFMKIESPSVAEIIGLSGFDFIIIDCEHGPISMEKAQELTRSAKISGMSVVIRVSDNNPALISKALDIGADAVQIPQINCKADAEKAVKASKYSPLGERGVCRYVRAAGYSSIDKNIYFSKANADTKIIIHIEGESGFDNIESILKVEGIDVIFIGPYDLSQSLGIVGDVNNLLIVSKMKEIVKLAQKSGKIVGTFVDDLEGAKKWIDLGVQYLAYSADTGVIYRAFRDISVRLDNVRN